MLDEALANDFKVLISLSPGNSLDGLTKEFARVDRAGNPLPQAGINGLYEPVQKFCEDVGYSAGKLYGRFPAFDGALIHSEMRDAVALSFSDVDRAAYRQATGADIPAEATAKWGVDRQSLANFPADGVIPDDQPLYRYFQWFWREGDAWPALNTATARGLKRGAADRSGSVDVSRSGRARGERLRQRRRSRCPVTVDVLVSGAAAHRPADR